MDPFTLVKPALEYGRKLTIPVFIVASAFIVLPYSVLEGIGVETWWALYRAWIGVTWLGSGALIGVHEVTDRVAKRRALAAAEEERKALKAAEDEEQKAMVTEIKALGQFEQSVLVKLYREHTLELALQVITSSGSTFAAIIAQESNREHEAAEALAHRGLVRRLGSIGTNKTLFRLDDKARRAIAGCDWEDTPVMLQVHPEAADRAIQGLIDSARAALPPSPEVAASREAIVREIKSCEWQRQDLLAKAVMAGGTLAVDPGMLGFVESAEELVVRGLLKELGTTQRKRYFRVDPEVHEAILACHWDEVPFMLQVHKEREAEAKEAMMETVRKWWDDEVQRAAERAKRGEASRV